MDMDGVLVKPGGYRAAVRATVNYFSNLLGLGEIAPDDDTIALFEAEGITCEWDMIPILLALALEAAVEAAHEDRTGVEIPSFQAARVWLERFPPDHFRIDFAPLLRGLGRFVRIGEAPSQTLLIAARNGQASDIFPYLSGQGVLDELLSNTRHVVRSRTTSLFEAFVLGDDAFAQMTGLQAPVHSSSFLAKLDQPLISPETRDHLRSLQERLNLRISAYTARPSQTEDGVQSQLAIFAPEAEMALHRIGWPELMVVGTGQAGEMATKLGVGEDRLTKPAPYHAIAAISAAWTGNRAAALDWTGQVFCSFEKNHPCFGLPRPALTTWAGDLPERLHLHIFEDSPAGMQGGQLAARLLTSLGMQVTLSLWGVSDHLEKIAALSALGAQVFPDVNVAVQAALRTIPDV